MKQWQQAIIGILIFGTLIWLGGRIGKSERLDPEYYQNADRQYIPLTEEEF